jgi:20S proteasome alpha/beta subunit
LLLFAQEDEAKQLVRDALFASTTTDLYSGSKINMFVLTKDKLEKFLPYEIVGTRTEKSVFVVASLQ